VRQALVDKIIEHKHYIRRYGEDMPEVAGWVWQMSADEEPSVAPGPAGVLSTAGDNV
jgi:xylulose-5-phosphate/fructose-6-phosphate phosphoketolase